MSSVSRFLEVKREDSQNLFPEQRNIRIHSNLIVVKQIYLRAMVLESRANDGRQVRLRLAKALSQFSLGTAKPAATASTASRIVYPILTQIFKNISATSEENHKI